MQHTYEAMEGITFGCDPELFIADAEGNFVCPDGIIPGTKEEPYPVDCGAVQQDGMAAEFNINPVTSLTEFEHNIVTVMEEMKKFLPNGHSFVITPSATFSKEVWDKASDKAKALGCSPDYNAWLGSSNPPPEDLENPYMRCAGGHLHIGWTEDADISDVQHIATCRDLAQQLDWYLGAWSVRIDKDKNRRRLYGKAGSMRFKDYGMEYRVLSNFWLANKYRRAATWNRMNAALWGMRDDFKPKYYSNWNTRVIMSINESRRDSLLEKAHYFPVVKV